MHAVLKSAGIVLLLCTLWSLPGPGVQAADTDELIALHSARLAHRPGDRQALLSLGDALARKGRETGDAGHFDRAVAELRGGVARHPGESALWRHLAYALSLRHDFSDAAEAATRALELNPADPDAHGVLGDALLELGRYEEAQARYRHMAAMTQNLASLSRLSGMASLHGDTAAAIDLQQQAVKAGQRDAEPAESIAWAQWQLGMEQINAGRLSQAQRSFRAALKTYPDYHRAHAGLGAAAAALGRHAEAQTAYRRAMAVLPLPEYSIALAESYAAQGRHTQAQAQIDVAEQLTQLGGGVFHRDVAHFFLDRDQHVARILAQSEQALLTRPDVQGHQLHAWALHKAGRHAEALAAITLAMRLGTREARLLYQAGMIHLSVGEAARGRALLREALRVNPRFHRALAARARTELAMPGMPS